MMFPYFSYLNIVYWTDFIEIGFLSCCIYAFCRWLNDDKQSKLLSYFYVGCTGFIIAYSLNLYAIVTFYTYAWPALFLIFMIIHQKSLQKNYVAARTIKPSENIDLQTWLSLIMSTAFKSLQYKKDLIFIIEGKNNLDEFIVPTATFNTPLQKSLCAMIIESSLTQSHSLFILTQHGTLRSVSSQWKKKIDPLWLDEHNTSIDKWEQEALYWTGHLDALVFYVDAKTKQCTVIAQANRVPQLAPEKAMSIISQYIRKNTVPCVQKNHKDKGASL